MLRLGAATPREQQTAPRVWVVDVLRSTPPWEGVGDVLHRAVDSSDDLPAFPWLCLSWPCANPHATTCLIRLLYTYLVEDNPVIRENLIATLEELVPVQVVGTAANEATAVGWLSNATHVVDLVIVDIFLQSGSGLGVLTAAQGLPQRYRLVVLTNFATPAMRRRCLELGADHVFDKSNDIEALMAYCVALDASTAGVTTHFKGAA